MSMRIADCVTARADLSTLDPVEPRVGLTVVSSPDTMAVGRFIDLRHGAVVIGRASQGSGLIEDSFSSRKHVRARIARGQVVVEDMTSSNGTGVNGRQIDGPAILERGDLIRIGATFLVVERDGDAEEFTLLDLGDDAAIPEIVGRSLATKRLRRCVRMVSATTDPVLVLGETGTGKEVTARAIHRLSGRQGPFVAVNCAAIPAELAESELFGAKKGAFTGADEDRLGYFAQSNGGTLFLDELGELPTGLQAKLLRALEDGCIRPVGASEDIALDLRVVAATNADLVEGGFREDLLARLEDWVLHLLPLAERRADILPLFEHFAGIDEIGSRCSDSFIESLLLYDWPLNARELRKIARRVNALGGSDTWHSVLLPPAMRSARREGSVAKAVPDRDTLLASMRTHDGNVSRVAQELGHHRKQVYRWLERHGISAEEFRVS